MTNNSLLPLLCAFTRQGLQTVAAHPDIPPDILKQAEYYCMPSGQACILPDPIQPALGCVFFDDVDSHFMLFQIKVSPRGRHARGALLFGHGLIGNQHSLQQLNNDPVAYLLNGHIQFVESDEAYLEGQMPAIVDCSNLSSVSNSRDDFVKLVNEQGFSRELAVNIVSEILSGHRLAILTQNELLQKNPFWPFILYRLMPQSIALGKGVATGLLMQGHQAIHLTACSTLELAEVFSTGSETTRLYHPESLSLQHNDFTELANKLVDTALDQADQWQALLKAINKLPDLTADKLLTACLLSSSPDGVFSKPSVEIDNNLTSLLLQQMDSPNKRQQQNYRSLLEQPLWDLAKFTPKFALLLHLNSNIQMHDWFDSLTDEFYAQLIEYTNKEAQQVFLQHVIKQSINCPLSVRKRLLLNLFKAEKQQLDFRNLCMDAVDMLFTHLFPTINNDVAMQACLPYLTQAIRLWMDLGCSLSTGIDRWRKALSRLELKQDYLFYCVWSAGSEYEQIWDNAKTSTKLLETITLTNWFLLSDAERVESALLKLTPYVQADQSVAYFNYLSKSDPTQSEHWAKQILLLHRMDDKYANQLGNFFATIEGSANVSIPLAVFLLEQPDLDTQWREQCINFLLIKLNSSEENSQAKYLLENLIKYVDKDKRYNCLLAKFIETGFYTAWQKWLGSIKEVGEQINYAYEIVKVLDTEKAVDEKRIFLINVLDKPLPGWDEVGYSKLQQVYDLDFALEAAIKRLSSAEPAAIEIQQVKDLINSLSENKPKTDLLPSLINHLYLLVSKLNNKQKRADVMAYICYYLAIVSTETDGNVAVDAFHVPIEKWLLTESRHTAKLLSKLLKAQPSVKNGFESLLEYNSTATIRLIILCWYAENNEVLIEIDEGSALSDYLNKLSIEFEDKKNRKEIAQELKYLKTLLGKLARQSIRANNLQQLGDVFRLVNQFPRDVEQEQKQDDLVWQDMELGSKSRKQWGSCLCHCLWECGKELELGDFEANQQIKAHFQMAIHQDVSIAIGSDFDTVSKIRRWICNTGTFP